MESLNDAPLKPEEPSGPFRVTPGFIAFAALLLLPAIVALSVFVGAALVANEVKTAEAQNVSSATSPSTTNEQDVAGWKRTLVGICPVH
jgi:hypothetical protein